MASNYHPPTETPLQELEGIEQLINQTLGHAGIILYKSYK